MMAAILCVASAIYFEARSEPIEGQAAVAWVIYNRTASDGYPSTACDVVHEDEQRRKKCQFSFMCDGLREDIYDQDAYARAVIITILTATNFLKDPTGGATHYHRAESVPFWAQSENVVAKINDHIFYKGVK